MSATTLTRSIFVGTMVLGLGVSGIAIAEKNGTTQRAYLGVAAVTPTDDGDAKGLVSFKYNDDGSVTVSAEIKGLTPGGEHGFHIHEYGVCKGDAKSAGDHYNPEGHPHGLPGEAEARHAGDLGNLRADENGRARLEKNLDTVTIAGDRNAIVGRSVIVHEGRDDGSQPAGDAGARIGCGVIGITSD